MVVAFLLKKAVSNTIFQFYVKVLGGNVLFFQFSVGYVYKNARIENVRWARIPASICKLGMDRCLRFYLCTSVGHTYSLDTRYDYRLCLLCVGYASFSSNALSAVILNSSPFRKSMVGFLLMFSAKRERCIHAFCLQGR